MLCLLTSCTLGHAEVVRRDQYGGVLALHGHQGAAMEDAQQLMATHCGGAYTVVAEEQVVVGQQTASGTSTEYGEAHSRRSTEGSQYTTSTTTTSNVTEYHITYQCGGAPAPPPVVTPQAAPVQQQPAPQPAPEAAPTAQPAY